MKTLLQMLICLSCLSACKTIQESQVKFASGEHVVLGDTAFDNVRRRPEFWHVPANLRRADGKFEFTYGELVAFAGDFYKDPNQLDHDTKTQSWFNPLSNNVASAKALFAGEASDVKAQIEAGKLDYRDNNLKFIAAFPLTYLEISKDNVDHFGWENAKTYVKYHRSALDLARKSFEAQEPQKSEWLRQALFTNAFADHFLTDGFASGHIRTPRAASLRWAQAHSVSPKAIGALAKLLHDNDRPEGGKDGLLVTNARGDTWHTRGDGQLYVASLATDKHIALPIEAVEISITEVLTIAERGTSIPESFEALNLVPFISPNEISLAAEFSNDLSNAKLNEMLKGLGLLWKLRIAYNLNLPLVRHYIKDLPLIMQDFQSEVAEDAKDPALAEALPAAYIEAYKNVR